MESVIANTFKRLFPEKERVLLAVSGGIDSMCMAQAARRSGYDFSVAHCNFHLRGEESDADEALVRSWCFNSGIHCYVQSFETEAYAASKGISIEMAARELRYGWFAQLCSEEGFAAVVIAHNANDNAETLILNLLRGTGIKGICGMAERSEQLIHGRRLVIVRPMLSVSRATIAEYAKANSVHFHEDRTNADVTYKRNRIRHEVLPVLETMNPSALQTLSADMAHFREASAIMEDYYDRWASSKSVSRELPVRVSVDDLLKDKHWKYLLFRLLEPYGFTASDIDSAADLLSSGKALAGKRFICGDVVAYFTSKALVISLAQDSWDPVTVTGEGSWTCGRTVVEVTKAPAPENPAKEGDIILDAAKITFPLVIRPWQEGDWMCPLGMGGKRRKLSDIFVSLKVASAQKPSVLLVEYPGQEERIAAIAGYNRIDYSLKVSSDTQFVIRIHEAGSKD